MIRDYNIKKIYISYNYFKINYLINKKINNYIFLLFFIFELNHLMP